MTTSMRQASLILSLLAAWVAIAAWQYHEFTHERERERADVLRQSDVLRQALLGGVRAHRRLGRVFEDQMQAVLDDITQTAGVTAVRITDEAGRISLSAGQTSLLSTVETSPLWLPHGLQTSGQTEMDLAMLGQGRGGGGPAWQQEMAESGQPLRFHITLLMDRAAMDAAILSAAQLRVILTLSGGGVLAAMAFASRSALRALEARSQTELLRREKERLEELSQAASGLAHETRNPLGVIRAGLQKRLGDAAAPEDESRLKLLVEECDRVTARINQFLAYARPQSAEFAPVEVGVLFEELQGLLQPDLEARQVQLRLCDDAGLAGSAIVADNNLLRQVLFNLLQNAISFSPSGKTIDVRLVKCATEIVAIEIADRGPGVRAEEVHRLFSPYFTTRPGGAGLGLAIVKRLVCEQGWSIRYQHRPGGGSLFLIEDIRVATTA
ncbi:MAG: hypothetical protein KDA60_14115 [Planctomycetales bacterium]|nr:hypothetical protein [Planctomycetales bacterium]